MAFIGAAAGMSSVVGAACDFIGLFLSTDLIRDYIIVNRRAQTLRIDLDFVVVMRTDISFPALLKQFRHNTGPTCLVARTNTASIVAMKILVEENQVLPIRI